MESIEKIARNVNYMSRHVVMHWHRVIGKTHYPPIVKDVGQENIQSRQLHLRQVDEKRVAVANRKVWQVGNICILVFLIIIGMLGCIKKTQSPVSIVGGVTLSPDRTKICFSCAFAEHPKPNDIKSFIMKTDGSYIQEISNKIIKGGHIPRWSPDGGRILFSNGSSLLIYHLEDNHAHEIVKDEYPDSKGNSYNNWGVFATWSQTGDAIVFVRDHDKIYQGKVEDISSQLCIYDIKTDTIRVLLSRKPKYFEPRHAAWVNDNEVIIRVAGDSPGIVSINIKDGVERQLVTGKVLCLDQSPVNEYLVFLVYETSGIGRLCLLKDPSQEPETLLEETGICFPIYWSIDGRTVLYRKVKDEQASLCVYNVESKETDVLVTSRRLFPVGWVSNREIIFIKDRNQIWKINLDSKEERLIYPKPLT